MALPEPGVVDEALPVPFHQVVDRVQLHQIEVLRREHLGGPEDGGDPEGELECHGDDLSHVAEEQDNRGGEPGEAEQEDDGGEQIVQNLYGVKGKGQGVE